MLIDTMKRAIITLTLAIVAVSASALTPEQMSFRAYNGLYGPVKELITAWTPIVLDSVGLRYRESSFDTVSFLPNGELEFLSKKWHSTYTDSTRCLECDEEVFTPGFYACHTFVFDQKGRLRKTDRRNPNFFPFSISEFFYPGDDMAPSVERVAVVSPYSTYEYTTAYKYVEFDSHGNWTKVYCSNVKTWNTPYNPIGDGEGEEYESYVLSRTITYY